MRLQPSSIATESVVVNVFVAAMNCYDSMCPLLFGTS